VVENACSVPGFSVKFLQKKPFDFESSVHVQIKRVICWQWNFWVLGTYAKQTCKVTVVCHLCPSIHLHGTVWFPMKVCKISHFGFFYKICWCIVILVIIGWKLVTLHADLHTSCIGPYNWKRPCVCIMWWGQGTVPGLNMTVHHRFKHLY